MPDNQAPDERKVYVRRVKFTLGAMGTEQYQESESFYLKTNVLNDDEIELTLLDYKDDLTPVKLVVSFDELADDYLYCPDYFKNRAAPEHAKEAKHVAMGDRHMKKSEFFSAEYEYDNAIKVNPESVRGHYGKGKALLEQGEEEAAYKVFENLAEIKELYGKEYKHTFNSLGIDLRKGNKLDEAIRNYERALYLDKDDEILHYNIAHAYFKKGEIAQGAKTLEEGSHDKAGLRGSKKIPGEAEKINPKRARRRSGGDDHAHLHDRRDRFRRDGNDPRPHRQGLSGFNPYPFGQTTNSLIPVSFAMWKGTLPAGSLAARCQRPQCGGQSGRRLDIHTLDRRSKEVIRHSRIATTRNVVEALSRSKSPGRFLFSASAIGYYGPRGEETVDETAEPGKDFLGLLAQDWEAEALRARKFGVRVVPARFGIILGKDGGALPQMASIFRKGLGGPLGDGKQWFSWIHIEDLVRILIFLIDHPELSASHQLHGP